MRKMARGTATGTMRTEVEMRIVRPDAHRVTPWKNGFGTTTEIAIDPPDAGVGGRFRWRLSIADVERSGPFSAFPGYERTIMVIAGNGMDLAIGGRPARRLDRLFDPFCFPGDSATECRLLDGPIRDFNLMVERSSLQSRLEVLRLDATPRTLDPISGTRIIHCFNGVIELTIRAGGPEVALEQNCTAILNGACAARGELQLVAATGRGATAAAIDLMPA
jgi:environmental stress-induced protein Ves